MHTVLIAEDDDVIRQTQKLFLEQQGYRVAEAVDGASLLNTLRNVRPDLILLDVMLKQDNGIELITQIKIHTDAPIIIVSSKKELVDKVLALEMGADDYVCKPVEMQELSSRIKANIRRYESRPASGGDKRRDISFGGWTMDFKTYAVRDERGRDSGLTTDEFQLLATLAGSPNVIFSRDRLFEILKAENYESFDRAIDIQIARIRKKLGDDARRPKIIKTIRKVGYIFIAERSGA